MVIALCTALWHNSDASDTSRNLLLGVAGWAGIVGFARVCLGRHYISDVLAGYACGIIEFGIGAYLFPKLKFLQK
jgi:membrane-associated phospholipid phosphatase